jgi:hypothetical protein
MSEMVRTVRKTYQEQQEQLRPTPAQQREREEVVLWRCRTRDNPARQPCPTTLPDNPARQPCPTTLPDNPARQPCPTAAHHAVEATRRVHIALPAGSGVEGPAGGSARLRRTTPDYAGLRRTTPPSTARSCRMCWRGWTRRITSRLPPVFRPSSARLPPVFRRMANGVASSQGSPACRGGTAITPAPTRSMATVPAGIMAPSS